MVNQQVITGKWNEIRGALKNKWAWLTDSDLQLFNANMDQLVGRIQEKTGETRESIEWFLERVADEGSGLIAGLRDKVEDGASHIADSARQGVDSFRQGYAEAERMVQTRPGQSVAVAFGLGLISGVGIALLLRERPQASTFSRGRAVTEQYAHQLMDKLGSLVADLKNYQVR
jgi:uncharacterized protein YjbJ (UPF0337 family)